MTDINASDLKQKNKVISFWEFEKNRIKKLYKLFCDKDNNQDQNIEPFTLAYKTYREMNKRCKSLYHKILLISIITAVVSGLYPTINMFLYSSLPGLATGAKDAIIIFVSCMLLNAFQSNVVIILRRVLSFNSEKMKELYSRYSRISEYKEVIAKPRAFFIINTPGSLLNITRQIRMGKYSNLSKIYDLLNHAIVVLMSTMSVMYISPCLFFLFLVIAIFNIESMLYIEEIKRKIFNKVNMLDMHISKRDSDIISNIPLIQESLNKEIECNKIFERSKYRENIFNKIRFIDTRNSLSQRGIGELLYTVILIGYIVYDVINTKDIGRFALITSAVTQFRWSTESLSNIYTQMSSSRNMVVDFEKKLATPKALNRKTGNEILQPSDNIISIENAKFSYPEIKDITIFGDEKIERGADVIKGISTQIKPGEITAIIGSSGQGKTTMLNLIRHDYDLISGSIKLGSKDITSLSDDEINKQISFIDQRVQFFDQTLLYNLKYFNEKATDDEVKKALDSAGLTKDVSSLKDGVYHKLGRNGSALSGGQRQRLALARIFLTDRPIMILDEPTTGLDQVLSFKVMKTLKEKAKNKTVLLVTHNPTEIALADRVIVIKDGQIESDGTPLDLIETSPFLKSSLTKQDILSKQKLFSKIA